MKRKEGFFSRKGRRGSFLLKKKKEEKKKSKKYDATLFFCVIRSVIFILIVFAFEADTDTHRDTRARVEKKRRSWSGS